MFNDHNQFDKILEVLKGYLGAAILLVAIPTVIVLTWKFLILFV